MKLHLRETYGIIQYCITCHMTTKVIGKMQNCGIRKVKCEIKNCENECRMKEIMWTAQGFATEESRP